MVRSQVKKMLWTFFWWQALVGTHSYSTNDARVLINGTAYQTDANNGDYDSDCGMNKDNSLNRFMKKESVKHYPASGEATLSGVIVDCNLETGLAKSANSYFLEVNLIIVVIYGRTFALGRY